MSTVSFESGQSQVMTMEIHNPGSVGTGHSLRITMAIYNSLRTTLLLLEQTSVFVGTGLSQEIRQTTYNPASVGTGH